MDEASLRQLISCLEGELSSLEAWAHIWTTVVILGCAGEAISIFREYWSDRNAWFKARTTGLIKLPEKPSSTWLILDILFVMAVVFGIWGELSIDRKSGNIQTDLRDANAKLELLFEREAGSARASADAAQKSAARAETASGTALAQSASAKTVADAAVNSAGKAKKEVDLVGKEIDDIHARLAWRHVDPKKRDAFIKRLKPFAGSIVAYDFDGHGNPEAEGFLSEFISLLNAAGWSAQNRGNFTGGVQTVGISCFTAQASKAGQALAEVVNQLPDASIRHIDDRPIPAGVCQIGIKPPA